MVERPTKTQLACAVTAAAAHDLNNELTVILSSVSASIRTLEPDHPAREMLMEVKQSAQRCAWRASELLNFSARRGVRAQAIPLEVLIEM